MKHWLRPVIEILQADTADLRALALQAGEDPRDFYVGTTLDGVDISGQDLRQMHFTGLNSAAVKFNDLTRLDPAYMRQLEENPRATRVLHFELSDERPRQEVQQQAIELIRDIQNERRFGERVGRLLATVLDDYRIGLLVFENYPYDQSSTVRKTVQLLKYKLQSSEDRSRAIINIYVAQIADELIRHASMVNRAALLIGLVHTIGGRPPVRQLLIKKIKDSNAGAIAANRHSLLDILG